MANNLDISIKSVNLTGIVIAKVNDRFDFHLLDVENDISLSFRLDREKATEMMEKMKIALNITKDIGVASKYSQGGENEEDS